MTGIDSHAPGMDRREFLKFAAGAVTLAGIGAPSLLHAAPPYRVGVGRETDGYAATLRAISASAGWDPARIRGRRVVIKPNLVRGTTADTGTITDPEVVRAVVDLALAAAAAEVWIVEASPIGAQFSGCGYDFFATYDRDLRVKLVDLADEPVVLAPVPGGLAYRALYLPAVLFDADTYLVTAAKLKVHDLTQATLAMKNSYGFPPIPRYQSPPYSGRFALHDRSVSEAAVDLNLARPIDFAVVDGIWGMEGHGPYGGDPVRMDVVVAGSNALAVDLVCLAAMQLGVQRVQHLRYAMNLGLGPADASEIEVAGDPLPTRPFVASPTLPLVSYPRALPALVAAGSPTTILFAVDMTCAARVEIVLPSELSPELPRVRLLRDWSYQPTGVASLAWDGRDDAGDPVSAGRYGIRVSTVRYGSNQVLHVFGWVLVQA